MKKNSRREFNWISSQTDDKKLLEQLDQKLSDFYSKASSRNGYQKMIDHEVELPKKSDFSYLILDYILKQNPTNLIELGCGSGRIYGQLKKLGFQGHYTGIEMADYIIAQNSNKYPAATWHKGSAYKIPYADNNFEIAFSFFVLEHLVYAEKALNEMMRVVKPGGKLVIVFPDFVESGRLESQELGFSPLQTAKEKLLKGKFLDAIVSLYDSKVRLKNALKNVHEQVGNFPVNLNLICFNHPELMRPDVDAVYIASKKEVARWAKVHNYEVNFPFGIEGELNEKAFVEIIKNNEIHTK